MSFFTSLLRFLLAAVALTINVGAAKAATFNWTELDFLASGTFTATSLGGGEYRVTGVTGTLAFNSINGVLSPGTYCVPDSGTCNDNILFFPPQSGAQLSLGGIGLLTVSYGNVGFEFGIYSFPSYDFSIGGTVHGVGDEFSATLASTPLPAPLSLLASGLGALGLLGWRRKRKAAIAD